jgi:hypothetical protein
MSLTKMVISWDIDGRHVDTFTSFFFDSFEKLVEQLSWQQKDTKRIIRKKKRQT